jgi:hypothetical protein
MSSLAPLPHTVIGLLGARNRCLKLSYESRGWFRTYSLFEKAYDPLPREGSWQLVGALPRRKYFHSSRSFYPEIENRQDRQPILFLVICKLGTRDAM